MQVLTPEHLTVGASKREEKVTQAGKEWVIGDNNHTGRIMNPRLEREIAREIVEEDRQVHPPITEKAGGADLVAHGEWGLDVVTTAR
jgi:hypothetical protein